MNSKAERSIIRRIEELSMNAWPALHVLHLDGWVLRAAQGYTRRANSIYPLYPTEIDLDVKLATCERFYRLRDLPTVFKITWASHPAALETRLEQHGYRVESLTSVQLLDMSRENYDAPGIVDLTSGDQETWYRAFARMNGLNQDHQRMHKHILHSILPEKCYASIRKEDHIVGCGLGVLQAGYLGIFDILIDPDYRGKGYGTNLVQSLMAWGQQSGAHSAYLQVMCDNEPALHLYENLGYRETYRYWYRIMS